MEPHSWNPACSASNRRLFSRMVALHGGAKLGFFFRSAEKPSYQNSSFASFKFPACFTTSASHRLFLLKPNFQLHFEFQLPVLTYKETLFICYSTSNPFDPVYFVGTQYETGTHFSLVAQRTSMKDKVKVEKLPADKSNERRTISTFKDCWPQLVIVGFHWSIRELPVWQDATLWLSVCFILVSKLFLPHKALVKCDRWLYTIRGKKTNILFSGLWSEINSSFYEFIKVHFSFQHECIQLITYFSLTQSRDESYKAFIG